MSTSTDATAHAVATHRASPSRPTAKAIIMEGPAIALVSIGIWAYTQNMWSLFNTSFWFGAGAALAVLIGTSQNHGNTLVTIGAAIAGLFPRNHWVAVWFALQCGGVFVVLVWLTILFGNQLAIDAKWGAPYPLVPSPWWWQLFIAAIVVIPMVLVILGAADRINNKVFKALVIGIAVGAGVYFSAKYAGGGVNTARDIVPMLLDADFNPLRLKLWPVAGELLGAVIAGCVYLPLRSK